MAGLGEILQENSNLREHVRQRDALLAAQTEQLAAQTEQLAAQSEQLAAQAALLADLQRQVAALLESNERFAQHFEFLEKRRQLAASERFIASELQGQLFEGQAVVAPLRDPVLEKEQPEKGEDGRKTAKHPRKGRRDVSALTFPRRKVEAPLRPSTCETCGGDRELVEPRVTHRVGWEPGHFTVVLVHQEACRCPRCPAAPVFVASEPFLLPGAMADDGLLARVLVDKFDHHLPLNRQADRMTREGFPIGENVLCGWVRQAHLQVGLLVGALRAQVAAAPLLLGDDSGFPVQDGADGKLANGRLWVFTDKRQAFFTFSRTKEGDNPKAVLAELGVDGARLVVDGGSEYNLVVQALGLTRGGCFSHLRRYFFNAAIQHPEAKAGLSVIQDLFAIERQLATASVSDRLAVRKQRSTPLVDGLYAWVKALSPGVRPSSKLGEAIGYALSQEHRMRVFLSHGDVPLHNNLSELLLRQPIVGRKNWLFSGSEGGARAAAAWFSLVASCRLQKIDPWVYLNDVFGRLLDHPAKWVHELTPLNWRIAVEAGDIVPRSPGSNR
jgi:transposase